MTTTAITFDDVLLVPAYNHHESRRVVNISNRDRLGKLELDVPIISANMDTVTESKMANFMSSKGAMGALHRFMTIDENVKEFKACTAKVFVSIGCNTADLERAQALRDAGAQYFVIDVAHAHAKYVGKTLKALRKVVVQISLKQVLAVAQFVVPVSKLALVCPC